MSRRILGAAVLGLLSSLIAHQALFGGSHAMGGAFSGAILGSAEVLCAGFLTLLALTSLFAAKRVAVGSVLAKRTAELLPRYPELLAFAGLWFTLGERLEAEHAMPGLPFVVAALTLCALVVSAVARWLVRILAHAVLSIVSPGHVLRSLTAIRSATPVVRVYQAPQLRRQFVRPPPSI